MTFVRLDAAALLRLPWPGATCTAARPALGLTFPAGRFGSECGRAASGDADPDAQQVNQPCRRALRHWMLLCNTMNLGSWRTDSSKAIAQMIVRLCSYIQDLMMVLMEQKHSADYGHAWDQFGENVEILGRELFLQSRGELSCHSLQLVLVSTIGAKALLASSLPAEHQAGCL